MANDWRDQLAGVQLTKAHGTGNDFIMFADPRGQTELTGAVVARLADRHLGIGADGVIRAVKTRHIAEGRLAQEEDPAPEWFMDYWNADGSLSEMCGNGVRVFVHYLRLRGLIDLPDGATVSIATRGGVKAVRRLGGRYAVDMGPWWVPGIGREEEETSVRLGQWDRPRRAMTASLPNPHTVVRVSEVELSSLDLTAKPIVHPLPEGGTNIEFVSFEAINGDVGELAMRVFERGVGETLSCGTGACAAVAVARTWLGLDAPREWNVRVPGGLLGVRLLESGNVELSGPAELVADLTLTREW